MYIFHVFREKFFDYKKCVFHPPTFTSLTSQSKKKQGQSMQLSKNASKINPEIYKFKIICDIFFTKILYKLLETHSDMYIKHFREFGR